MPEPVRPFLWLAWPFAAGLAVFVVLHELRPSPSDADNEKAHLQKAREVSQMLAGPAPDHRRIARELRRLPIEFVCDVLVGGRMWPGEQGAEYIARSTGAAERAQKLVDHIKPALLANATAQILARNRTFYLGDLLKQAGPAAIFAILDRQDLSNLYQLMELLVVGFPKYPKRNARWSAAVHSAGRFPKALGDLSTLPEQHSARVLAITSPALTLRILRKRLRQQHNAIRELRGETAARALLQRSNIEAAMALIPMPPQQAAGLLESLSSTDCARVFAHISLISPAQIVEILVCQDNGAPRLSAVFGSMPQDPMLETIAALAPKTAAAIIVEANDAPWSRLVFTDAISPYGSARISARILNTLDPRQVLAILQWTIDRAIPLIRAEESSIGSVWPSYIISTMDDPAARKLLAIIHTESVGQLLRAMEPEDAARLRPPEINADTQVTRISIIKGALGGAS